MRPAVRQWRVLAGKGFAQNLQYSASHIVNTIASVIFGLIYIYVWRAVTPASGFGQYTSSIIVQYICVNQTTAWFTQFGMKIRHRIAESVRSGRIAVELARPMDFFHYRMAFEYGAQLYSLVFRGLPVGIGLSFFAQLRTPGSAMTWLWALASLAIGGYIGIALGYLVGISSFWTNEIRTLSWVVFSLQSLLGGISMPLEVLPRPLELLAKTSPFAHLAYYPARIYLGLSGPAPIMAGLAWAAVLTIAAHQVTALARRRLEVQGG
ncbi:MAG: ABC-2 family transporter protein [Clostridia bacterium]|nr:ABC-2 family transporter protein [Clostridia bacterium]